MKALKEGAEKGFTPMLVTADEILWERLTINGDEENGEDFLVENVRKYREKILSQKL